MGTDVAPQRVNKHRFWPWGIGLGLLLFLPVVTAGQKARVPAAFAKGPVWVFFVDKGPPLSPAYQSALRQAEERLAPRARQRRSRIRRGMLVDWTDLPVYAPYVDRIVRPGVRLRTTSRWLNAISIEASSAALKRLVKLPFVAGIQPVAQFHYPPLPAPQAVKIKPLQPSGLHSLDYGPSLAQLDAIRVPAVHDAGYSGQGVLIALLDSGFDLNHEAFSDISVVAKRDFIHQDEVVSNEVGQDSPGQDWHGTQVLSAIGGFAPGKLIGVAYGAQYALAKTEELSFEQPVEEDWWVAGIEWADSLGADVVSSSLGYLDWYSYADMDGQTAVTTRAADLAVAKGIVVVNAMGNERQTAWHYMIAPADGDSVISVGAATSSGQIASFSSVGPTFDGRIKPDVAAPGVGILLVHPDQPSGYLTSLGTSFATPLVAGVTALLLEAYPDLTPIQIRTALRSTASQADQPDTLLGWGIVDAQAALEASGILLDTTLLAIEGTIRYDASDLPVAGASLAMQGTSSSRGAPVVRQTVTNRNGRYRFADLPRRTTYRVFPDGLGPVTARSITAFDASLILAQVVGQRTLDWFPLQRRAADVSGDSSITALDASQILRHTVGFEDHNQIGRWGFSPDTLHYQNLEISPSNGNFRAWLYGDVSGNWTPSSMLTRVAQGQPVLTFTRVSRQPDGLVAVGIGIENSRQVQAGWAQFDFDPRQVEPVGVRLSPLLKAAGYDYAERREGALLTVAFAGPVALEQGGLVVEILVRETTAGQPAQPAIALVGQQLNEFETEQLANPPTLSTGQLFYPAEFALHHNYPNPFNPATTIPYQLPRQSPVRLVIYNTLGQEVCHLVDRVEERGFYTVIWDGTDDQGRPVKSGIYFYGLETPSFSRHRKMVLVR